MIVKGQQPLEAARLTREEIRESLIELWSRVVAGGRSLAIGSCPR